MSAVLGVRIGICASYSRTPWKKNQMMPRNSIGVVQLLWGDVAQCIACRKATLLRRLSVWWIQLDNGLCTCSYQCRVSYLNDRIQELRTGLEKAQR